MWIVLFHIDSLEDRGISETRRSKLLEYRADLKLPDDMLYKNDELNREIIRSFLNGLDILKPEVAILLSSPISCVITLVSHMTCACCYRHFRMSRFKTSIVPLA